MFIEPKYVHTSVGGPGLDVPVVRAVPLIERFENVDPEMKSPGHGYSAGQHIAVLIDRLFAWVIRDVALPAHSALSVKEIRHLNSVGFTRSALERRAETALSSALVT